MHRCRSRQLFGGAKEFCPNSHKLARKSSSGKFGRHFFKSKHVRRHFCSNFQGVVKVLSSFARILWDFASIFTESKLFLGVRLHPLHPRLLRQCFHGSAMFPLAERHRKRTKFYTIGHIQQYIQTRNLPLV